MHNHHRVHFYFRLQIKKLERLAFTDSYQTAYIQAQKKTVLNQSDRFNWATNPYIFIHALLLVQNYIEKIKSFEIILQKFIMDMVKLIIH